MGCQRVHHDRRGIKGATRLGGIEALSVAESIQLARVVGLSPEYGRNQSLVREKYFKSHAPVPVICVASLLGGVSPLILGACTAKRSLKDLLPYLTISFLIFSIFRSAVLSLLFGYCLTLTSSTKAMFLTKIEPYIVLLIQILFYGHRTTPAHLLLLAAHLAGAVVLSTGGSLVLSEDRLVDLLILVAVTGNAALYGPSQRYSQQMGALYASGISQLIGGIVPTAA